MLESAAKDNQNCSCSVFLYIKLNEWNSQLPESILFINYTLQIEKPKLKKNNLFVLYGTVKHIIQPCSSNLKKYLIAIYTHIINVKSISPLSMESSGAEETNVYQESYCMDKYKTSLQF